MHLFASGSDGVVIAHKMLHCLELCLSFARAYRKFSMFLNFAFQLYTMKRFARKDILSLNASNVSKVDWLFQGDVDISVQNFLSFSSPKFPHP